MRYPPSRAQRYDVVPLPDDRVDVFAYTTKIDRLIEKRDLPRFDQVVLEIGVMEIETVRRGDHTGAIVVPIEQIEGGRLVPHEIAVDERVPDQVIGAQKIEHLRHVAAVEIAALKHASLHELDLRLVHENSC